MFYDNSETRAILQNQTYGWSYTVSYTDPRDEDLHRRQTKHLEEVQKRQWGSAGDCLHNSCPECVGTGIRRDGSSCIHLIACNCSRCGVYG